MTERERLPHPPPYPDAYGGTPQSGSHSPARSVPCFIGSCPDFANHTPLPRTDPHPAAPPPTGRGATSASGKVRGARTVNGCIRDPGVMDVSYHVLHQNAAPRPCKPSRERSARADSRREPASARQAAARQAAAKARAGPGRAGSRGAPASASKAVFYHEGTGRQRRATEAPSADRPRCPKTSTARRPPSRRASGPRRSRWHKQRAHCGANPRAKTPAGASREAPVDPPWSSAASLFLRGEALAWPRSPPATARIARRRSRCTADTGRVAQQISVFHSSDPPVAPDRGVVGAA
jgi:hypothetical protein